MVKRKKDNPSVLPLDTTKTLSSTKVHTGELCIKSYTQAKIIIISKVRVYYFVLICTDSCPGLQGPQAGHDSKTTGHTVNFLNLLIFTNNTLNPNWLRTTSWQEPWLLVSGKFSLTWSLSTLHSDNKQTNEWMNNARRGFDEKKSGENTGCKPLITDIKVNVYPKMLKAQLSAFLVS